MQPLLETLKSVGLFLVFLLGRFLLLLLVLALLTVVFLAGLALVRVIEGLRRRAIGFARVDGLMWRRGLSYAPGHTWLDRRKPGAVRVGLDDLAQRLLSRTTAIRLPKRGEAIRRGEPAVEILCGKHRASIFSPVTGTVVAVNDRLSRDPALLNRDPYARGWMFAVASAGAQVAGIVEGESARAWLATETHRLTHYFERELGRAAAAGGELVAPAPALLSEDQWHAVTQAFLRPPEN
jgi:glycine cleavage system H lipoate-binding protein